MINLPKSVQMTTITEILADPAFDLMYARSKAKAFLTETGRSETEADEMVEVVLGLAAETFKEKVVDKGLEPKAKIGVTVIKMPQNE